VEGTGIVAVISLVLTLVVMWWKKRESPEARRDRIMKDLEERINEGREAIEGGADDIASHAANQHDRILRETGPPLQPGGDNQGNEQP